MDEKLNDFEKNLVLFLRKKKISQIKHTGSFTIHYDKELKPVKVEIKQYI